MEPISNLMTHIDENIDVNYALTFEENIRINETGRDVIFFTAFDRSLIDNAFEIDEGVMLTCLKILKDVENIHPEILNFYVKWANFLYLEDKEIVDILSIKKLKYNDPKHFDLCKSAKTVYDDAKENYFHII